MISADVQELDKLWFAKWQRRLAPKNKWKKEDISWKRQWKKL